MTTNKTLRDEVRDAVKKYNKELFYVWQNHLKESDVIDILVDNILKAVRARVPEKGIIQRYPIGSAWRELQLLSDGFDAAIDQLNKELGGGE